MNEQKSNGLYTPTKKEFADIMRKQRENGIFKHDSPDLLPRKDLILVKTVYYH